MRRAAGFTCHLCNGDYEVMKVQSMGEWNVFIIRKRHGLRWHYTVQEVTSSLPNMDTLDLIPYPYRNYNDALRDALRVI